MAFLAFLILTVSLTTALAAKTSRLACVWGALWGGVLGTWLLAPALLEADRIIIRGPLDWFTLSAILTLVFATIGAGLIWATATPIAIWTRSLKPGDSCRPLAFAYAVPVVLVPAYVAGSLLLEFAVLPSGPSWPAVRTSYALPMLIYLASSALLLWMSRLAMQPDPIVRNAPRLAAVLVGMLIVGAGTLPLRTSVGTVPRLESAAAVTLVRDADPEPRAPLLVVGLDSGNWDTIAPLVAQGRLPVFASLINAGVSGNVRAEWPPYWSAPAWSSIVTGFSRDDLGLHEDLVVALPGLQPFEVQLKMDIRLNPINLLRAMLAHLGVVEVAQHSRDALVRPPVWETLAREGVRTAVLRFPFTYPASGPAAYVVSNRVDTEGWEGMGVRRGHPDRVVYPASLASDMHGLFSLSDERVTDLLRVLDPAPDWPNPRDARTDLRPILRSVAGTDSATMAAARRVMADDPSVSMLMLYIGGFDVVCHAFWPYRFPESYPADPPAPDDVERLGGVIDRYLEYLDTELGRLIATFPRTPNVLIVSDHGHTPTHAVIHNAAVWRGWHGPEGVFIAAGPDVAGPDAGVEVSYYDIVPTILSLRGFRVLSGLQGRVVVQSSDPRVRQ